MKLNRRNFLKSLTGLLAIPLIKPAEPKVVVEQKVVERDRSGEILTPKEDWSPSKWSGSSMTIRWFGSFGPEEHGGLERRVRDILRDSGRIKAMQFYRERTGAQLAETRDYIDRISGNTE